MELDRHIHDIHEQVLESAEAGGPDAIAVAGRLVGPLDAAIRLALQDAVTAAAEEITLELAPGSVDVRLRGRELEFVVAVPPTTNDTDDGNDVVEGDRAVRDTAAPLDGDESAMARINLRLPEQLKARVEHAAGREGLSVNAWLVRVAGAAVDRAGASRPPEPRSVPGSRRYRGWAR